MNIPLDGDQKIYTDLSSPENLIRLKIDLLVNGTQVDNSILKDVGKRIKEQVHWIQELDFCEHTKKLPASFVLPNEILVQVRHNPNSHYLIAKKGKSYFLSCNGEELTKIELVSRPDFYRKYTSSQIPMTRIGVTRGLDLLSISYNTYCPLFESTEECQFCSVDLAYEKHEVEILNRPEDVSEVASEAFKSGAVRHFVLTGGYILSDEKRIDRVKTVIEAIRNGIALSTVPGVASLVPPRNLKLMDRLYDAGIDWVSHNIEVYDPKLFAKICPGKQRYVGRDGWLKALEYSTQVFGHNKVRSNFIAGLEPFDTLVKGAEDLASKGVVPTYNIWMPYVGARLPVPPPDNEFCWQVGEAFNDIYHKYGLKLPWCHLCAIHHPYFDFYRLM